MDVRKFNGTSGELITTKETINGEIIEYDYFHPKPIPKDLRLDKETIKKLSDANLCLGELKGLTNTITNIHLFTSIYKRREAVLSSKIEGTRVSLTDVFLNEAGSKETKKFPDMKEVMNYIGCLNFALDRLEKKENINKEFINNMHYVLLKGVRGSDKCLGEFRKQQNWIGRDRDIKKAEFVPPHYKHIQDLMNIFFDYMNLNNETPRLIKIGLMHYYFETIHPYEDGNGRLGRTLILLYLNQLNVIKEPILYLSPYFDKYKENYYSLLMEVRYSGDYISWLNFFLDGIREISKDTSERIKKLLELQNVYKEKLTENRATSLSFSLLNIFFQNPYASIPMLQKTLKKNYPLIKRGIDNLKECGIIQEITHRKRNKFYFASEVLEIIEKEY